jgi:hypothetical protein
MYARAVDEAGSRLEELRRAQHDGLLLGGLALALAIAATWVVAPLALPLFAGGVFVGALGVRALWRRWDLVDRLAGERDAYVISEVLAYAARETTMERRHSAALAIRRTLEEPGPAGEPPGRVLAAELEALAEELDDEALVVDPASAVACTRLLGDLAALRATEPRTSPDALRWRVRRIRSGFDAHGLAA